jgi:hypothetical protein
VAIELLPTRVWLVRVMGSFFLVLVTLPIAMVH